MSKPYWCRLKGEQRLKKKPTMNRKKEKGNKQKEDQGSEKNS